MADSKVHQTRGTTSRRRFLQTSGLIAGAAAGLSIARSAHAAGSEGFLNLALIGCGGRGTGAVANAFEADPRTRLVAMADAFEDRLQTSLANLKKRAPDRVLVDESTSFVGFDAYQKAIDADVDVVLLATPPHFRPIHLKAAIEAGKHVFCEKPVAVDAPGVRSVLQTSELAAQKGLSLVSGLCWRYHTATRETIQRIRDGAIGDVVTIQETYNTGMIGGRTRDPSITEMEYQMRNWYCFTWLSGDHNVEQHVHSLDKALWVMGDEPPAYAWGLGGRQVRTEQPRYGQIYDHHAVCYEYENGVRVYSFCRQMAGCWNDTTDKVFGTKGTGYVLNKFAIEGETSWKFDGSSKNMYVAEHEALYKSIRENAPINNGKYMAYSTMMAILGRMTTYTGQRISWEQAIQSEELLAPKEYDWEADPPVLPDADGHYPVATPGVTKFA
ncbi:Gfo/Idh/MocA family oxidoreductase [Thermostilla marina]